MVAAQVLYNLLLTVLAVPAAPVAGLALLFRPRYRRGLTQRLGFLPQEVLRQVEHERPLWVHAPSVGEILATRPFLQVLKQQFPSAPLLLSTLTPTAYTAAREKIPEADAVMYFPLDHPFIIHRVLRHLRPTAFCFTETEMWPNFLLALARRKVPTFLVSGRFSPRALRRYRLVSPLFRPVFRSLTRCCMQTTGDRERLIATGALREKVIVTGNFKFDAVNAGTTQGLAVLQEAGLMNRPRLIGASTHPGEEEFLLHTFQRLQAVVPNLLLLLAPRHPQRFLEVERLLQQSGCRYAKRSRLSAAASGVEVFLLDTLGELSSFYHGAAATFVGGSLTPGPGGHSVVEPALARTPVCFGPYTRNFSTIVEQLLQAGGGFVVHTQEECYQQLLPFLTDIRASEEAGRRAYEVMQQGQGAVQRTLAVISEALQTLSPVSLSASSGVNS